MDFYVKLLNGDRIIIKLDEKVSFEDVIKKVNEKYDHNYTIHNISKKNKELTPQTLIDELILKPGYELDIQDLKDKGLWNIESFVKCDNINLLPVYLTHFDINDKENEHGSSILIETVERNDIEMFKELIKIPNININIQNNCDYNPLIVACQENYQEIALILLDFDDIDINVQNIYDRTALMYTAYNSNAVLTERLSQFRHLNPYLKDERDEDALDFACEYADSDICETIQCIKSQYDNYLEDVDENTIIQFNIPNIGQFSMNKFTIMNMIEYDKKIEIPFDKNYTCDNNKVLVNSYKNKVV